MPRRARCRPSTRRLALKRAAVATEVKSSCCLQRRVQAGVLADDSAAIAWRRAAVAFRVDGGQGPPVGRRDPQSQEVALPFRFVPIDVGSPIVKDRVIVEEL